MSATYYKSFADETRDLFWAFRLAGFTEEQAMTLVATQFSFSVIQHQRDDKRKRTELLQRNISRWKENQSETNNDVKGES